MNPNQYGLNFTSQEEYENEYNRLLALARKENIESLINETHEPQITDKLKEKIMKFLNRFSFFNLTIAQVVEEIRDSELLAAHFIIEPTKQNFYEKTALKFIHGILGYVDESIQLPNKGPRAFYIINGMLQTGLIENPGVPHKSIDFRIPIPNTQNHIYISHKHTDLDGGAQKQSFADLNHFVSQSNLNVTPNYFVAIADGNFYNNIRGRQRISKLKQLANNAVAQNKTYATNIFGFRALYNMIVNTANPN
jgi:hypothetical protein